MSVLSGEQLLSISSVFKDREAPDTSEVITMNSCRSACNLLSASNLLS